jgi:UPF0042 nucleotide-binding protein
MGWFVIDNLPAFLVPKVGELASSTAGSHERVALVMGGFGEPLAQIEDLQTHVGEVTVVFLDATTEVLVRRYESTRRRHPLAGDGDSVATAIERERALLEPVKAEADVVVDTTELNVHQLRDRVRELFGTDDPDAGLQLRVESFGFKHGLPLDVDMVLDCRFLPNPHWDEALRPLTGMDEPVRRFVLDKPETVEFVERLRGLLELLLPAYEQEGKSYLSVAFGCTGGRHRSVAIAEDMADWLRSVDLQPTVTHRDVDR